MIEILKALADENRMRIYNLLTVEERCVCEIEAILSITQSNASRHLNRLKGAGIIDYKKKSQWVYYQINEVFIKQHGVLYEYLNSQVALDKQCVKDIENLKKHKQMNKIPCN